MVLDHMAQLLIRAYAIAVLTSALTGAVPVIAEDGEKGGASGKILADSGFRPRPNGFGFENWGGDQYPVSNLTGDEAAYLFGDRVCARFEGDSCVPTAAAKLWLTEMNQMMQGGRCEGMAALSAAFHVQEETVGDYGAKQPFELKPNDATLMRTISTYFVTQALEPVQSTAGATRGWTLQQIVDQLMKSLKPGGDYMTLGIYGSDGGHAVTPYKVEELGAGLYRVFVYDNNYPGSEKYIDIDVPRDRWVYAGAALNPKEDPAPWEGGAGTMDLTPLSIRYEALECPFCGDHVAPTRPQAPAAPEKPRKPAVASGDYIVFTPARCSQLQATRKSDKKQLSAGKKGAKNELGKASMVALRGARGCVVRLPKDQQYDLAIMDDGRPSRKPETGLVIFGPGNVYSVSNIALSPTTTQRVSFDKDRFEFQAGGVQKPTIRIAGDRAGGNTIYEVTGFTLSDGRTFGAKEDDTGKVTFNDDDPSLDTCDISAEEIDVDGSESFEVEDIDLGDDGQVIVDIDDEGRLDVDLDSDGDGTPNDNDADDDNDGTVDAKDSDDDNDGVSDDKESLDSDADSVPDAADTDDDNDGEVDAADQDGLSVEADEGDTESADVADDAAADDADADADVADDAGDATGDDVADEGEATADSDDDGTADSADSDDDNDGTPDATDSDDDNDGVADEQDTGGEEDVVESTESSDEADEAVESGETGNEDDGASAEEEAPTEDSPGDDAEE